MTDVKKNNNNKEMAECGTWLNLTKLYQHHSNLVNVC